MAVVACRFSKFTAEAALDLIRTAKPHKILDPAYGPLIAVTPHVFTRKSLGGIHTDLDARFCGRW
ncbi:MAG: putative oxidoreductase [Yoonia sp.]